VTDFRRFLALAEPVVLPYFGGTRVDAANRRWRVVGEAATERVPEPGWWRFRIEGRRAVPVEPAPAGQLAGLPAVRGHWTDGWIVVDGRRIERVALAPDDEPPPLARVAVRRWYSGDLLFDAVEFEDDAELAARRALEQLRPLGALRGVAPSLRTAFGIAFGAAVARELGARDVDRRCRHAAGDRSPVCLGPGHEYRTLTLDAMPSVVREAIETDRLHITRRP
jgi:hypothetical protein